MKRTTVIIIAAALLLSCALQLSGCREPDESEYLFPEQPELSAEQLELSDRAFEFLKAQHPELEPADIRTFLRKVIRKEAYYDCVFTYCYGDVSTHISFRARYFPDKGPDGEFSDESGSGYKNYPAEIFNCRITKDEMRKYRDKLYKEVLKSIARVKKNSGGVPEELSRELYLSDLTHFSIMYGDRSDEYYICYVRLLNYATPPTNPDYADQDRAYAGGKVRIRIHDAAKKR